MLKRSNKDDCERNECRVLTDNSCQKSDETTELDVTFMRLKKACLRKDSPRIKALVLKMIDLGYPNKDFPSEKDFPIKKLIDSLKLGSGYTKDEIAIKKLMDSLEDDIRRIKAELILRGQKKWVPAYDGTCKDECIDENNGKVCDRVKLCPSAWTGFLLKPFYSLPRFANDWEKIKTILSANSDGSKDTTIFLAPHRKIHVYKNKLTGDERYVQVPTYGELTYEDTTRQPIDNSISDQDRRDFRKFLKKQDTVDVSPSWEPPPGSIKPPKRKTSSGANKTSDPYWKLSNPFEACINWKYSNYKYLTKTLSAKKINEIVVEAQKSENYDLFVKPIEPIEDKIRTAIERYCDNNIKWKRYREIIEECEESISQILECRKNFRGNVWPEFIQIVFEYAVGRANKISYFSDYDKITFGQYFINHLLKKKNHDPKEGPYAKFANQLFPQAKSEFLKNPKNLADNIKLKEWYVAVKDVKDWPFFIDTLKNPDKYPEAAYYKRIKKFLCKPSETDDDVEKNLDNWKKTKRPITDRFSKILLPNNLFYDLNLFPVEKIPEHIFNLLIDDNTSAIIRKNRFLLEMIYPPKVLVPGPARYHTYTSSDAPLTGEDGSEVGSYYDNHPKFEAPKYDPDLLVAIRLYNESLPEEEYNIIRALFYDNTYKDKVNPKELSEKVAEQFGKSQGTIDNKKSIYRRAVTRIVRNRSM